MKSNGNQSPEAASRGGRRIEPQYLCFRQVKVSSKESLSPPTFGKQFKKQPKWQMLAKCSVRNANRNLAYFCVGNKTVPPFSRSSGDFLSLRAGLAAGELETSERL